MWNPTPRQVVIAKAGWAFLKCKAFINQSLNWAAAHEKLCKLRPSIPLEADPGLKHRTYLYFCAAQGLDHQGQRGAIPSAVALLLADTSSTDDCTRMEDSIDGLGGQSEISSSGVNTASLASSSSNSSETLSNAAPSPGFCVNDIKDSATLDGLEDVSHTEAGEEYGLRDHRSYNEAFLKQLGPVYHRVVNKCIGVHWLHGYIPWPDQAVLTLDNTRLKPQNGSLTPRSSCAKCCSLRGILLQ
ncbi:hypothetical protein BDZ45DRAFT_741516 [Acephala macrosclerotiorum]|nr:hypothetical protein BDZ45DRAFT_741516 [Acephala macrosclerotiorum]